MGIPHGVYRPWLGAFCYLESVTNLNPSKEIMNKKKCNECRTEIDSEAKRCPSCRADQRNLIRRHPVISIIVFIFLFITMMGTISSVVNTSSTATKTKIVPVTQSNIDRFEADLKDWGEGRWSDVVTGIADDGAVLTRVYVSSLANEVAINGYCEVIKKSAMLYIPYGNRMNTFIYQNGEIAKTCL